ncbi:MAG: MFS transporter [Atopobiaceae bacterium]|nr:MFS transporter [Atopobiaceae bacterium]
MNLKNLNFKYALVSIGYMLLISGSLGFAFNYLSQVGFEPGVIGTVMSVVSLAGVFLGPIAGDLVDRSQKITQKLFIIGSMIVCALAGGVLLMLPARSLVILPVIVVAFVCSTIGMPMLNGMAFSYERFGGTINYGLCRGIGSAAYAVGSNLVGQLWAVLGTSTLPLVVVAGALLTAGMTLLMPEVPRKATTGTSGEKGAAEASLSIPQFFGRYRSLVPVIGALVLLYFCHNIVNTYMGALLGTFETGAGVESTQGTALFIQAMVELPTMFGFALLLKRMSVEKILAVAAIFYSIKHVLVLVACNAGSVPLFYAAMVLQMLSFAAITPGIVYFANKHVAGADQNKGQAVFATANTVGGLLASFVGGWMFELIGVMPGLTVGVVASCAGTLLMLWSLRASVRA